MPHTYRLNRAGQEAADAGLREKVLTALVNALLSKRGPQVPLLEVPAFFEALSKDWPEDLRRYLLDHLQYNLLKELLEGMQTGDKRLAGGPGAVIAIDDLYSLALRQQEEARSHVHLTRRKFEVLKEMVRPETSPFRDFGVSAPPPDEEEEVAPKPSDPVTFSVCGPSSLQTGNPFTLDLWAFTEAQRGKVETLTKRLHETAASEDAKASVQRGTMLTAQIQSPFLDIQEPTRVFHWTGQECVEWFDCTLKPAFAAGGFPVSGTVLITVQGMLIANIQWVLNFSSGSSPAQVPLQQKSTEPKTAFASYSSENRLDVLARVQGINAARPDLEIFLDVDKLRQGEKWEEKLYAAVSSSDILYLFWSTSASKSPWVDREWRYAFDHKGLQAIAPVPLESPQIVKPPQELGPLNFNDKYLMYIYSQQRIDELRKK